MSPPPQPKFLDPPLLYIVGFNPDKIRAASEADNEVERLHNNTLSHTEPAPSLSKLLITHFKVRGLLPKVDIICSERELQEFHVLCFSETHLQREDLSKPMIGNWTIFQKDPSSVLSVENLRGGGVASATAPHIAAVEVQLAPTVEGVEGVAITIACVLNSPINIVAVYRRETGLSMEDFLSTMDQSLKFLPDYPTVVVGDFNSDVLQLKKSTVSTFFQERVYQHHISTPATITGTCIDHAYKKKMSVSCYGAHDP